MRNRVTRIVAALALVAVWAFVTWRWMSRWADRAEGGRSVE